MDSVARRLHYGIGVCSDSAVSVTDLRGVAGSGASLAGDQPILLMTCG